MSWTSVHPSLSTRCLAALEDLGFSDMTPVQSAAIPYFMQGKDVAVQAVTGSGKTLAFVVLYLRCYCGGRLHGLKLRGSGTKTSYMYAPGMSQNNALLTGALVLAPTRELAVQIAGVFRSFLPTRLTLAVLIGGQNPRSDIQLINSKGAHVVVCTPGRLVDLLTRPDCTLVAMIRALEILVLDEADRLLDLGFKDSITTVLSILPKQRRTGLFSATLNQDVRALIHTGLRNPVTVTVTDKQDPSPTPATLQTYYMVCSAEEKFPHLLSTLQQFKDQKTIVFFSTCASVTFFSLLTRKLVSSLRVLSLHGQMRSKRNALFSEFASLKWSGLSISDVMARGVDFPNVDWVIQFDPPAHTKAFVHRVGRTARMGQKGQALVMLLPTEVSYVEFLELNQHIRLQSSPLPSDSPSTDFLSIARDITAKDRDVYEQGMRAFVSFVHFYYKHECKLIFRPKDLDLVSLARGFALLHLPKMPELRGKDCSDFEAYPVDTTTIPYKDKHREKQRLAKLKEGAVHVPRRKLRKAPPKAKKEHSRNAPRKRKREELSEADLAELSREARLLKKFKAGKITKSELDSQLDGTTS